MKESVTKFDFEAAFKALDDLDIPNVKTGIKANRAPLTEIFSKKSKSDTLIEDYYNVGDSKELEDAQSAREAEVAKAKLARIEKIVDLDAESPEDLLTSYVGKVIIQCPQCMTLFYKNKEDIEESEDDPTVVNVNEVCQHCGNESGYTLIGKVGEVTPEEAENYESAEELDTTDDENLDLNTDEIPDDSEEEKEETSKNTDDEDIDLDLEIEEESEEEAEEESKEESFFTSSTGASLNEQLDDLTLEEDAFDNLLQTDEFKTKISDHEVRAMLAHESMEEQHDLDEGIFDKIKDKVSTFLNKPTGLVATANWLLENTLNSYDQENNESNLKFTTFLTICFKSELADGTKITKAPSWDNNKLLPIEDASKEFSDYKGADAYGKAQSTKDEIGAVLVYLYNKKNPDELSYLSMYFDGNIVKPQTQIDTYYKEVMACYNASKYYQKQMKTADKYEVKQESLSKTFEALEEVQEKPLENGITKVIKNIDENINDFKLTNCDFANDSFTITGTVNSKTGESTSSTYLFTEAFSTGNKLKLRGICESAPDKSSVVMTGHIDKETKTFIAESLAYKQLINKKIIEGCVSCN